MADTLNDVLVCAYPDVDTADKDFEALIAQVQAKAVRIQAVILITHDADGNVAVQRTGDNLGRKGLKWGGGVGFLVGLAAPPLLAATAIGAAGGAIVGKFAAKRVDTGLGDMIGEALKPGTAVIVAMLDDDQRLGVEKALGSALARSVAQSDKSGDAALKDSLAEAMGKFKQDRTVLPIPEVRSQFTHAIDLGPTILDLVGLPEAKSVDGIEQQPMDGTSFAYSFDEADAEEQHTVQYFENYGSRAIYKDGWWACAKLDKLPWDLSRETLQRFGPDNYQPEDDVWELYYLPDDFSQAHDLAGEKPDKLEELKELFWQEAERNNVLPLLGGFAAFFGMLPPMPTETRFPFAGDVQNVAVTLTPHIQGRSYAIEADLQVPEGGAEGVIVANADFIGGYALWVDEQGLLNHTYQFLGVETYKQTSTEPIPTGDVEVKMQFEADEPKPGTGGTVSLWANGKQIGEGHMPRTVAMLYTTYAGMDIGRDNGGVVDLAYEDKAPYAFTGTVNEVVFDLKPAALSDEQELHEHRSTQEVGHGMAG